MALNEHNNTRQYTKYKRHVNESHERVDARTVNSLQEDLNTQQKQTNKIKDNAFEERVYTIFNNNLYANAMFVDYFKTGEYVNLHESSDVEINPNKTQVVLKPNATTGTMTSTLIYSVHGSGIELNDFFLITSDYVPQGASIKYYLELSTGERWPIVPNALKLPLHLHKNIRFGFKVVAELTVNALNESPVINGYAILYWDAEVEVNYGMTNPDLQRFPTIEVGNDDGTTILIRDRAQDDKVVQVIAPQDTVDLIFDWEDEDNPGRLKFIKDHWPNYRGISIDQINKLHYGSYVNSLGETENVLLRIEQATEFGSEILEGIQKVRTCSQCPIFDGMNTELESLVKYPTGGETT